MSALPVPRQEAFAFALATGLSQSEASAKAGYANSWKHTRRRAARPDIAARVTALRDEVDRCETSDAAPVAKARTRVARKAGDSEGRVETPEDITRYLPLSDEDWMAEYGHRG